MELVGMMTPPSTRLCAAICACWVIRLGRGGHSRGSVGLRALGMAERQLDTFNRSSMEL
jgi:hypothetical protein